MSQENLLRMVRWMRWHCPPDTVFEIRTMTVWGRARYFSVTEAPHNTEFYTWMGKTHFCFCQTAETGKRTPNSSVKGSGANHYPRAPARPNARCYQVSVLPFKAKIQYLLTLQVSRYCILASQNRFIITTLFTPCRVTIDITASWVAPICDNLIHFDNNCFAA